jgi:hypothetical protein
MKLHRHKPAQECFIFMFRHCGKSFCVILGSPDRGVSHHGGSHRRGVQDGGEAGGEAPKGGDHRENAAAQPLWKEIELSV